MFLTLHCKRYYHSESEYLESGAHIQTYCRTQDALVATSYHLAGYTVSVF